MYVYPRQDILLCMSLDSCINRRYHPATPYPKLGFCSVLRFDSSVLIYVAEASAILSVSWVQDRKVHPLPSSSLGELGCSFPVLNRMYAPQESQRGLPCGSRSRARISASGPAGCNWGQGTNLPGLFFKLVQEQEGVCGGFH